MTTSTPPESRAHTSRDRTFLNGDPDRRGVRIAIVFAAILVPQTILYWPSISGSKIALPVDLLYPLYSDPTKPPPNLNEALWDPIAHNEPCRKFIATELHAGRMPLWNPAIFCGAPLFTNAWSPFQWPYYVWPDPALLAWTALLKSLVSGGGAFLFFRRSVQAGYWPAVFGAAIYPLTMFFVLWQYYMLSSACAWLPWLLLCTDSAVRRPGGYGPVGVAAVTAAIFFEGLGAPWPHLLLASGLYMLWILHDEYGWRRVVSPGALQATTAMVCAWGIGGGLSAAQNLPALDYLRTSHRVAARSEGKVEQPPAGLRAWTEWLFPYHSGDMTSGSFYLPQQGNQLEGAASASSGMLAALVLAPLAFCDPRKRSRNFFWLGLGLFGMAFQADIPLVSEIFRIVPFKALRNNRFTFYTGWVSVALAVNGLEVLLTGLRRWRHAFWIPVLGIVVVGLHTWLSLADIPELLKSQGRNSQTDWFRRIYCWELVVCGVALGAWWFARNRRWRGTRVAAAIAGLTVTELLFNAWGFNPQCDRSHYYPATPITEAVRSATPGRVAMARYLRPNAAMMYGLSEVRGYDGADPLRLVQLYRLVDPEWPWVSLHAVTSTYDPPQSPIMDMLNLRYVFHAGLPPTKANVFAQDHNGWLEERKNALPRVYVPRRVAMVTSDAECLEHLQNPNFDALEVAFVPEKVTIDPSITADGSAEIVVDGSQRVVVTARMRTPGMLVLADSWDAGWKAYVNGREAAIARVNFVIRGVELATGESTVEFRYEPASFTLGLRIFVSCAVALAAWGGTILRSRRSGAGIPAP